MFLPEQVAGWKKVVDAVHAKGGYFYLQLWHAGRATIPQMTGSPAVSSSATPWDDPAEPYTHPPVGSETPPPYAEYPPIELSHDHIKRTIQDYCDAAKTGMDIGFDGVEIHSGNGYLPEQFLSSNINKRTDEYGGTPEKRCRFVLELMDALAKTIGEENLAIRLSPFGLYNQARGEQRVETWTHLCREIKSAHPKLSFVDFIEPVRTNYSFPPSLYFALTRCANADFFLSSAPTQRYEQIFSYGEKDDFLKSWGLLNVDLAAFREIFGDTPFFSAGGWDDTNSWGVLESGRYDAFLYGRYFISNPDIVERLKRGIPLSPYDRSRFYGPFEDRTIGYTDYPTAEQQEKAHEKANGAAVKN